MTTKTNTKTTKPKTTKPKTAKNKDVPLAPIEADEVFTVTEADELEDTILVVEEETAKGLLNFSGVSFGFRGFDTYRSRLLNLVAMLPHMKRVMDRFASDPTNILFRKVSILYDFLKNQQRVLKERRIERFRRGVVRFWDIPELFPMNKDILFKRDGLNAARSSKAPTLMSTWGGVFFEIEANTYYFTQGNYYQREEKFRLYEFDGEKPISELRVQPLNEENRAVLRARNAKYMAFTTKPHRMFNPGIAFKEKKTFWDAMNIQILDRGRCIVDLQAFAIACPDHAWVSTADANMVGEVLPSDCVELLPATVPGYSLEHRIWLEYSVDALEEISWDSTVFGKVVLDTSLKNIIWSLVQENKNEQFSDIIANKGGGVVFLLSGPPGTGKTLTAEAVAEASNRPLLRVSLQDLGISPDDLERNLERIFQMAREWDAVFLLDEADVFLESRKSNDLTRNAVVAAFLRHLEYFHGILFLTTNNERDLDPAVLSRVTLPIHFGDFTDDQKLEVWKNLLREAKIQVSENEIRQMMAEFHPPGNGRQIKNAIRTAAKIAHGEGRGVTVQDLKTILGYTQTFVDGRERRIRENEALSGSS